MVPAMGALEIVDSWAGLRPMVGDGLPVLGGIQGILGLNIATAHFRNGILLAPLTARVIADAICGGKVSRYLDEFGTARFDRVTTLSAI
jgi:glycine oxidase